MKLSAERSTVATDPSTTLALARTHAANERTLMAWIRTGISLITFGFTIYKFFNLELKGAQSTSWIGPRGFGTAMILIGLVSLVLGIVSHRRAETSLRHQYPMLPHSPAMLVAGLVTILGLFGLVMIILEH
jgi:putative membrane protein